MANDVVIKMTAEDTQAVQAWQRAKRGPMELQAELDKVGQKGRAAGGATSTAFDHAGKQLLTAIGGVLSFQRALSFLIGQYQQWEAAIEAVGKKHQQQQKTIAGSLAAFGGQAMLGTIQQLNATEEAKAAAVAGLGAGTTPGAVRAIARAEQAGVGAGTIQEAAELQAKLIRTFGLGDQQAADIALRAVQVGAGGASEMDLAAAAKAGLTPAQALAGAAMRERLGGKGGAADFFGTPEGQQLAGEIGRRGIDEQIRRFGASAEGMEIQEDIANQMRIERIERRASRGEAALRRRREVRAAQGLEDPIIGAAEPFQRLQERVPGFLSGVTEVAAPHANAGTGSLLTAPIRILVDVVSGKITGTPDRSRPPPPLPAQARGRAP